MYLTQTTLHLSAIRNSILRTSEGWRAQKPVAAREGVIAMAYEGKYGDGWDRFLQMAKYFIYSPSAALYTCPLAMSDGASRLIEVYGDQDLKQNAFKRLISRDPKTVITSGQWMTEVITQVLYSSLPLHCQSHY
jgi:hypothetical protein